MLEFFSENLILFWVAVALVCLVMEIAVGDFYIMSFAFGALLSAGVAVLGCPFWLQIVVWAVCSVLSVLFLRPRIFKWIRGNREYRRSNADALIGRIGEVSERIPLGGYGRVKIDGDDWKAVSAIAAADLEVGEKVEVLGRESIILDVKKV